MVNQCMDQRTSLPVISVICPVYNDSEGVRRTILSLQEQTYPDDRFEIIVVDNNSTDSTRNTATRLLDTFDNGQVIDERNKQSSYAARNTGLKHATGELIALIDADITVDQFWLADLVEVFNRTGADYVGCDVVIQVPDNKDTIVARYNAALGFPIKFYLEEHHFAGAGCLAVHREVIDDVGGFDENLVSSGDLEFGQRVYEAGYDMHYASDIKMYHPARTSLSAMMKKGKRIGKGQQQLHREHPDSDESRPITDFRNILPPHPGNFMRRLDGNFSPRQLIPFYLLSYIYKLQIFRGRLSEWVDQRKSMIPDMAPTTDLDPSSLQVSVIIPTYNRPERVGGAVKSVLTQTHIPEEIIVVNDNSDQSYEDVVKSLPDCVDYIELETNMGGAGARNHGVERASGDILMFLDDDDRWRPQKVERQLNQFDRNTALVYSGRIAVDEERNEKYRIAPTSEGDLSHKILIRNLIGTTSCAAVRAEIFERVNGFDPNMPGLQDWDLWIRICQHGLVDVDPSFSVEWTVHENTDEQISGHHERYVDATNKLREKYATKFNRLSKIDQRKARAYQYHAIASAAANAQSSAKYPYIVRSLSQWPTFAASSRILPQSFLEQLRKRVTVN